jgi:hypothetical protein
VSAAQNYWKKLSNLRELGQISKSWQQFLKRVGLKKIIFIVRIDFHVIGF